MGLGRLVAVLLAGGEGKITGLYRHAVKGLSADSLDRVKIQTPGETFPDDRRFALLLAENSDKFDTNQPKWLHKSNFLCAFSDPKLLSTFETSFRIVGFDNLESQSWASPCDQASDGPVLQRLLTVRDRKTQQRLLGPVDLETDAGRQDLERFFGEASGKNIVCVACPNAPAQQHQFGNTSSGVKAAKGDTRTLHLINEATVRELSETAGVRLNPTRFRPNIVLDGLEPWQEFDLVGKKIQCGSLRLAVLTRTIRCDGVSVDPLDPGTTIDIPNLLTTHYPHHGPYLGVYARVEQAGEVQIGDSVTLL